MPWLAVVTCLVLTLVSEGGSRVACDCVVFPTTEADRRGKVRRELQEADAVFAGTMTDLVDTGNSLGRRVAVLEVWKGTPGKDVVLASILRNAGNSCWYMPDSGQHLIFARRDASGWWIAYSCGSTGPLKERAEVSRFLKELCKNTELCGKKARGVEADPLPNIGLQPTAARASIWCRRG